MPKKIKKPETPKTPDMDTVREQIMLATLANVPFDGWCREAINAGAIEAGYDSDMALRAFPGNAGDGGDVRDVIELWGRWSDTQMLEQIQALAGWDEMGMTARIEIAIRTRIMLNAAFKETTRKTLSWLAMPFHIPIALQSSLRTVNEMWYAAGDTATDWNYYSKRGLLSTVYSATVLYWISDTPDDEGDYPETWAFLNRRLKDLGTFSKAVGSVGSIDPVGKIKKRLKSKAC